MRFTLPNCEHFAPRASVGVQSLLLVLKGREELTPKGQVVSCPYAL